MLLTYYQWQTMRLQKGRSSKEVKFISPKRIKKRTEADWELALIMLIIVVKNLKDLSTCFLY